jgi:16S rRNA U516 pseudouridylate synthase RsuA-like enzyme
MFLKLGYEVKRLVRTRIGPLNLGNLQPGQWRLLSEREVALLKGDDTKGS